MRIQPLKRTARYGELLGLAPAYMLVPPEFETAVGKLVATVTATATIDVNAFGSWTVLVDARLADPKRWYLFASPDAAPVFVRAVLAGFEAPSVQSQIDFMTDNTVVKVNHNFGFAVADCVGGSTNQGV
jgi:hypothetical protein